MSKPYMLSYDLDAPGQRYEDVKKCIEKEIAGAWCHYLESTYLFRSSLSASEIMNKLEPHLDSNDKVFVTVVSKPTNGWLTKEQFDWINKHIFID